ncbi:MAG TPA: V-type ATP synthase subunit D [Desulfurivibrionaceae bacterium]|nr:V-type ATP synthase subunit D [Desulfurivibrionaceae bacterium]
MIHPNRTYLLQQKERQKAVAGSLNILKARRQALIMEFLASARPFLLTRRQISAEYRRAIEELQLAQALDSKTSVASVAAVSSREIEVSIEPRNILGVRYKEVLVGAAIRTEGDDGFVCDPGATAPALEEATERFLVIVENMLKFAGFESKLKRLARDIGQLSRKSRVLEQRVLPELGRNLRAAVQYIGEREREDHYRLKKFKDLKGGKGIG